MKFEGYNPTPEEMQSAEQMMTPEQRLASDLREKALGENFEIPESATEQQKAEVEKETGDVAKIFNEYGRPWFLAGGTSLELAQGEITRDHQDSDIAIHYKDVVDFFDYARGLGYKFVDTDGKDIPSKEDLVSQRENAFLHKIDEAKPGPRGFEIMFLRSNKQGEIIFGADENLTFPIALYEGGQKYTAKNGQEVPLTPKEVQILYKIFDGRQKDFHDVKTFLPTLSQEERQRLNGYLESVGATFVVGDKEAENIDELLQLAEATTKEAKENFLDEIKKEFGEDLVARRKNEFNEAAKFLFGEKKPTQEEFREFAYRAFNFKQYLEEEVKRTALDMRRWEVRTKDENVER